MPGLYNFWKYPPTKRGRYPSKLRTAPEAAGISISSEPDSCEDNKIWEDMVEHAGQVKAEPHTRFHRLMDLPLELRKNIYAEYFRATGLPPKLVVRPPSEADELRLRLPSLCHTSHQIRSESFPLLLLHCKITIGDDPNHVAKLARYLYRISGEAGFASIRSLTFESNYPFRFPRENPPWEVLIKRWEGPVVERSFYSGLSGVNFVRFCSGLQSICLGLDTWDLWEPKTMLRRKTEDIVANLYLPCVFELRNLRKVVLALRVNEYEWNVQYGEYTKEELLKPTVAWIRLEIVRRGLNVDVEERYFLREYESAPDPGNWY